MMPLLRAEWFKHTTQIRNERKERPFRLEISYISQLQIWLCQRDKWENLSLSTSDQWRSWRVMVSTTPTLWSSKRSYAKGVYIQHFTLGYYAGMKEMMMYYSLRGTCTCSMILDNPMRTNGLSMRSLLINGLETSSSSSSNGILGISHGSYPAGQSIHSGTLGPATSGGTKTHLGHNKQKQ